MMSSTVMGQEQFLGEEVEIIKLLYNFSHHGKNDTLKLTVMSQHPKHCTLLFRKLFG